MYVEDDISIHIESFDKDFDDIDFDPHVVDDSDDEAAETFGY